MLLNNNNNNFVWIDDAGTAKKRSVKIGELTNNGVVVLEGLSVGDALITEGQHKISEGMEIVTINE